MRIGTAVCLVVLLAGCATVRQDIKEKPIHFTASPNLSPDITIESVQVLEKGKTLQFTIRMVSGKAREFSFFDPPDGDTIMYILESDIGVGNNILRFNILKADLQKIDAITMKFGFNEENFIMLNYYDVKVLL